MGADYKEIDGGIYDNPDVTIREALHDILEDLKSQPDYNLSLIHILNGRFRKNLTGIVCRKIHRMK